MPSQRVILGIGLPVLLMIGAASIGLDVKSRSAATEAGQGAVPAFLRLASIRLMLRKLCNPA